MIEISEVCFQQNEYLIVCSSVDFAVSCDHYEPHILIIHSQSLTNDIDKKGNDSFTLLDSASIYSTVGNIFIVGNTGNMNHERPAQSEH